MNTLISIILPVFNGLDFLGECIASVQAQTYTNWELLIGINGYHCESLEARTIAQFSEKKIKVIHIANKPSKVLTLNELTTRAQGELICLIDVDDLWLPEKLQLQRPRAADFDVVGTNAAYFGDRDGSPALILGKIPPSSFLKCNQIINSSAMLRREDAAWDVRREVLEDYALWLRLAAAGRSFYNLPEVLCWHRIHQESFFNTKPQPTAQLLDHWRHQLNEDP